MSTEIKFGIDRLIKNVSNEYKRGSWGLVTNDAARLAGDSDQYSRKAMADAGVSLSQLFSPEHGIKGTEDDGNAVDHQIDSITGLNVYSLYGATLKPPESIMRELDGIFFDIPDIGARFYTYLWSLSSVMEACAESGTKLIVLDRPNPLGGDFNQSEGPLLDTYNCASYLGRAPMPVRHSLTTGEFSQWLKAKWQLNLDLEVIPVTGWNRNVMWPGTGLPFIPTSPSMPDFDSVLCYPGTCFFEATNLSVGRGTDKPFRQVGAPWLDPVPILSLLNSFELPGVIWESSMFTPEMSLYQDESCKGVLLKVTDSQSFRPVLSGLTLLAVIRKMFTSKFRWAKYPSVANPTGKNHFELLIGQYNWRKNLEEDPEKFIDELPQQLSIDSWKDETGEYLIYE